MTRYQTLLSNSTCAATARTAFRSSGADPAAAADSSDASDPLFDGAKAARELAANQLALKGALGEAAGRHSAALAARLGQRGAARAEIAALVAEDGPALAAAAAVDAAAAAAAAAIAADRAEFAAVSQTAKNRIHLAVSDGTLETVTRAAVDSVFDAARQFDGRVTRYPISIWRMTISILSSPTSLAHIPYRYSE